MALPDTTGWVRLYACKQVVKRQGGRMCRIYRPAVARASAIFASNSSAVQVENETAMSDRRTKSERESAGQFYLTGVLDISPSRHLPQESTIADTYPLLVRVIALGYRFPGLFIDSSEHICFYFFPLSSFLVPCSRLN